MTELNKSIDWIADTDQLEGNLSRLGERAVRSAMWERLDLVSNLKQSTGTSALMHSGGGALTMNQAGMITAFIRSGI
ncbi:MAG: hypothetical protein ACREOZ_02855 [Gloeomargaritales cyanobacterium]